MATFCPGFRFSAVDAIVLVIGALAAALVIPIDRRIGASIAFVVGHFFLFCNVLRLWRPLELIWAGAFILLAASASLVSVISWPWVFALSVAMTLVVAILGMRLPSYHGVGWRTMNPKLPEWWRRTRSADGATHTTDSMDVM